MSGIDPMVAAAVSMKQQNVREAVGYGVLKMALNRVEEQGTQITEMMDSGTGVSLDSNLGNLLDIIA